MLDHAFLAVRLFTTQLGEFSPVDLIQKGAKLFVQGHQCTRSWEKDGIKHRLTEVDADEFLLLDSVNKASESSLTDDVVSQGNWVQTYPEQDF